MIEQVTEAKPHLIVLTGDYMNVREGAVALNEVLGVLKAPFGVIGIEGNWDTKFLTGELFQRAGATWLVDDTRLLERDGRKLRVVGQGMTPSRTLQELLPAKEDGAYTIFLHHMPDAIDELRKRDPGQRVDLFLCGHTHGGQIRVPGLGPLLPAWRSPSAFAPGETRREGMVVIVNRGMGMSGGPLPRARLLSRPEIRLIEISVSK